MWHSIRRKNFCSTNNVTFTLCICKIFEKILKMLIFIADGTSSNLIQNNNCLKITTA